MKVVISNKISIVESELDWRGAEKVREDLTWMNPEYLGVRKTGRSTRGIKPQIFGWEMVNGKLVFLRGYKKLFLSYLDKKEIPYEIEDETIEVPSDLRLSFPEGMKLRPYQKKALYYAKKEKVGIITMPCGAGKTITMINIIAKLKQKTLIIVNTEFIKNQWIEYFKNLFDYDLGVIQGTTCDIKDITIAMSPTLAKDKVPASFYSSWGCVVLDEAHHCAADQLHKISQKFNSKYLFGTTATAQRNDGLDNLMFSLLGNVIYSVSHNKLEEEGYLKLPSVKIVSTDFLTYSRRYQTIIKQLTEDADRNRLICDNIYKRRNNYNIVISNRINHLENLIKIYSEYTDDYELIISQVKADDRNAIIERMKNGALHTIFATQLADEGLDIPILDTIHLVFPTKAQSVTEQRIGRVQRPKEEQPLVLDYVDHCNAKLFHFSMARQEIYNKLKLKQITKDYELNEQFAL